MRGCDPERALLSGTVDFLGNGEAGPGQGRRGFMQLHGVTDCRSLYDHIHRGGEETMDPETWIQHGGHAGTTSTSTTSLGAHGGDAGRCAHQEDGSERPAGTGTQWHLRMVAV